jgi:transposase
MGKQMHYKVGVERQQISLLPVYLDEYISENHICRVIDAFTRQLDLCALEAEMTRNVEVMWLMNELKPDDKTICNFRKDNAKALKQTFRSLSCTAGKWK